MNEILRLKGRFEQGKNKSKPGPPSLPKGQSVTSSHLFQLAEQLTLILDYWKKNKEINGALVSVHYKHIVAKSNRLKIILAERGKTPTDSIRGAKFEWETESEGKKIQKHVFTHYISLNAIEKSIELLKNSANVINKNFGGSIDSEITEMLGKKTNYFISEMKRTTFLKAVVDGFYVDKFDIDRANIEAEDDTIITIYQTGIETKKLLSKFGINIVDERIIDETTLRLTPDEVKLLYNNASYLIAMGVTDFSEISREDISDIDDEINNFESLIPHPTNEPIIGVIDTQFNDKVYFHEWVEYKNLIDSNIDLTKEDYAHGTAVSSIIVDGPRGNPNLDDGCGRFRVRHFGVARQKGFSSFTILKMIRNIVASNRDIKVWNLSLGSRLEIKQNFISNF